MKRVTYALPALLSVVMVVALAAADQVRAVERDGKPDLRWQTSDSSVALMQGTTTIWQFNYESSLDVPCFHPLSSASGQVLTWDRPPDHAWHHGVWFGWKFINGVNYWEHIAGTEKAEGRTEWSNVRVVRGIDSSARIRMTLSYRPAQGDASVLTEQRWIDVSAPDAEGVYTIDWTSAFKAGDETVKLDRVPPQDQSWGGYAGLSVRFARHLVERQAVTADGPARFGTGDRHRGHSEALDYNGLIDGRAVGLAFLDHPDNPRHPTAWYAIRSPQVSYINAALLADAPLELEAAQTLTLRYRLIVHPDRWDAQQLQAAFARYKRAQVPPQAK